MVTPFLVLNDKILNFAVVKHNNMMKPNIETKKLYYCSLLMDCVICRLSRSSLLLLYSHQTLY